ncbi:uncharacterized protein LOC108103539 [Drosophila eugracilis]|uniref:uncharacterized protein LOC108103539 n=1 Tax=Drosophila eugracilis TaxID=29029 RepID=UPI0007E6D935|nr:uncharacterized protein LOC108103539 [Drosophila eugracilis]
MNPFRPRHATNRNYQQLRDHLILNRLPNEVDAQMEQSMVRALERRLRVTQMPGNRLRLDHQPDVERFMVNLRIVLRRQRSLINQGAGDGGYLWNIRDRPIYTGKMGEGDGLGYDDFNPAEAAPPALPPTG